MSRPLWLALGGVPASGKSTLTLELLDALRRGGPRLDVVAGTCVGRHYEHANTLVLGRFPPGHPHPGTDMLSMAVQPVALAYAAHLAQATAKHRLPLRVVAEGDRLFNLKTFQLLEEGTPAFEVVIAVMHCRPDTIAERRARRGNRQPETFLRSRETKVFNIERRRVVAGLRGDAPPGTALCGLWSLLYGDELAMPEEAQDGG